MASHRILGYAIIYPCLKYLLLTPKSSYIQRSCMLSFYEIAIIACSIYLCAPIQLLNTKATEWSLGCNTYGRRSLICTKSGTCCACSITSCKCRWNCHEYCSLMMRDCSFPVLIKMVILRRASELTHCLFRGALVCIHGGFIAIYHNQ